MIRVRIRTDIKLGTQVQTETHCNSFTEFMLPTDPARIYYAIPSLEHPDWYIIDMALNSKGTRLTNFHKSWLDFNIEPDADKPQRKKNDEKHSWKERAKRTYNVKIRTDIPLRTIFEDDRWSDVFSIEMYPITPDTFYKAKPDEECPGWYALEKFVDDVSCEFKYHESWLIFEDTLASQSTQKQQPSPIFHFPNNSGVDNLCSVDTRCIAAITPITLHTPPKDTEPLVEQYGIILKNSNKDITITRKPELPFKTFERIRSDLLKRWEQTVNQFSN